MSYLPRTRCRHEYVTVSPEGFRFRGQMFGRVNDLFRWFKEHFRDPVPGQSTPSTPRGAMTSRTPYHTTPGAVSGKRFIRRSRWRVDLNLEMFLQFFISILQE